VPNLLSDDGTGQASVKTSAIRCVRVVARFTFPVMQGNKTYKPDHQPDDIDRWRPECRDPEAAVVLSTPVTVSGWSGVTQLYGNNANSQAYLQVIIMQYCKYRKRFCRQTSPGIRWPLYSQNGSAYDMSNSGTNTILIRQ